MASPSFGRSSILSAGRPGFGSCRSPPNSGVTVMAASSVDAARHRKPVFIALVLLLLAGLPVAAWFDLRHLSETLLRRQASDLNSLISGFRAYYASNVVGRVLAAPGHTQVVHNYADIPGAIPIPATLSIELGHVVSEQQHNIAYRFVSDFPFKNRPPHELDDFERGALASLRQNPKQQLVDVSWSLLTNRIRYVVPIIMGPTCVACHDSHPESPKRDWKVGDVRGIQEVVIAQPLATNIFAFKYLAQRSASPSSPCRTARPLSSTGSTGSSDRRTSS